MRKGAKLVVGDKIELFADEHHFYKTIIWDIYADKTFLIPIPSNRGIPMLLHADDIIYVIFYRESGRYMIQAKAINFIKKGEVRCAVLNQISQAKRSQRRQYYRLPISLKAEIYAYAEDSEFRLDDMSLDDIGEPKIISLETAETKNLSVTGAGLETKLRYETGKEYHLKIHLDDKKAQEKTLTFVAEIVRVSYVPEKKVYRLGVHFLSQDPEGEDFLSKYILARQQEQIVKERLISGDI